MNNVLIDIAAMTANLLALQEQGYTSCLLSTQQNAVTGQMALVINPLPRDPDRYQAGLKDIDLN